MREKPREPDARLDEELDYRLALSKARVERALINYAVKSRANDRQEGKVQKTRL